MCVPVFVNMTYSMLMEGAAFCRDPHLASKVDTARERLEVLSSSFKSRCGTCHQACSSHGILRVRWYCFRAQGVMEYHASSASFDQLADAVQEQVSHKLLPRAEAESTDVARMIEPISPCRAHG